MELSSFSRVQQTITRTFQTLVEIAKDTPFPTASNDPVPWTSFKLTLLCHYILRRCISHIFWQIARFNGHIFSEKRMSPMSETMGFPFFNPTLEVCLPAVKFQQNKPLEETFNKIVCGVHHTLRKN